MLLSVGSLVLGLTALYLSPPPAEQVTADVLEQTYQGGSHEAHSAPGGMSVLIATTTQVDESEFKSADEAFAVGAAFYNARNLQRSRKPFEAAIRLAKEDAMRLKTYRALLHVYREVPEFEPFQTAAEYLITNNPQSAGRSVTRSEFLSFAINRGQIDKLVTRYEAILKKDKNNYLAVYMLSEIYSQARENPERAIEVLEQLLKLETKKNPTPEQTARDKAKLARQYIRAGKLTKGAKLYEEIAPLDSTTHAWDLKEAAVAWLKDKNQKQALKAALAAEKAPPESRSDLLAYYFHHNMGDIFLELKEFDRAVNHYEIALEKTKIEGHLKDTQASLDEAKRKSKEK